MLKFNYIVKRDGKVTKLQSYGACYAGLMTYDMKVGDEVIIDEPSVSLPPNLSPDMYVKFCLGVLCGYFDVLEISCSETNTSKEFKVYIKMVSNKNMPYRQFLNPMTAFRSPLEFHNLFTMLAPLMVALEKIFESPLLEINAMILTCALAKYSLVFNGQGGHICVTATQPWGFVFAHDNYLNSKANSVNSIYMPGKTSSEYLLEVDNKLLHRYADDVKRQINSSVKKGVVDEEKRRVIAEIMAANIFTLFPDKILAPEKGVFYGTPDFFTEYEVRRCESNPSLVGSRVYYCEGVSSYMGRGKFQFSASKDSVFPRIEEEGVLIKES